MEKLTKTGVIYLYPVKQETLIHLAHGAGGKEMESLIDTFKFTDRGKWENCDNDAATYEIGDNILVFTTDSFTVEPIFFPGGDIGHLAMCGTINDLCVMGAEPIGISFGLIVEEGFPLSQLKKIVSSIKKISRETSIPVATGDTKVMEKNKLDKIVINTSGIGIVQKGELLDKKLVPGDKIIISGGLGEHATAILSKRFNFETEIQTDSKPILNEIRAIKSLIKQAKDPTRGGIASALNELSRRNNVGIIINEDAVPVKKEVRVTTELLGINPYELACEGRFIAVSSSENAETVVSMLKKYNENASIIGEVVKGDKVIIETFLGKKILSTPTGRIVPRIC